MAKDSLIDYPGFNPEEKVVFPPTGPATDDRDKWNTPKPKRYDETFDADSRVANPAETNPAAPDIRQPFVDIDDKATLNALSPDAPRCEDPRDCLDKPEQ